MLDWDKPLSQQPQAFKDAVSAREQQRMMPILEQRRATLAGLPQGAENASILKKQIAILEDEITKDVSLMIVDFSEPDEVQESIQLWENQVSDLKHVIGSV